jgi:hypothetical protein
VTPVIFLGPEFVIPNTPELAIISGTNTSPTQYGAFNDGTYTRVTFGFGLEAKLYDGSAVSLRLPLQVRGSTYPGLESTRSDRERTVVDPTAEPRAASRIEYKVAWEYQVAANFGLSLHF